MTETSRPVRVFTAMVADLFHYGHVNFLRDARCLGDHLTVGIVSDRRALSYKRRPILNWEERQAVVEACRYVDAVIELDEDVTDQFMQSYGFDLRAYAVSSADEECRYFATIWSQMDRSLFRKVEYTASISTTQILDRIRVRMTADDI